MTAENRLGNITEELARAEEASRAADLLFRNGLVRDAVSKLYYELLYHVRALLLTKELEPRSHEGALRLFSLHFVKPAIFEPQAAHLFSRLMKLREEADYDPSYVFASGDYAQLSEEAKALAVRIRDHLKDAGYERK